MSMSLKSFFSGENKKQNVPEVNKTVEQIDTRSAIEQLINLNFDELNNYNFEGRINSENNYYVLANYSLSAKVFGLFDKVTVSIQKTGQRFIILSTAGVILKNQIFQCVSIAKELYKIWGKDCVNHYALSEFELQELLSLNRKSYISPLWVDPYRSFQYKRRFAYDAIIRDY